MSTIDELYLREKHNGLMFYDTLKLTFLFHLEYLYSHKNKSLKRIDDLFNELKLRKNYKDDELINMTENARNVLKAKYNIEVIKLNPICYKQRKDLKNENH